MNSIDSFSSVNGLTLLIKVVKTYENYIVLNLAVQHDETRIRFVRLMLQAM